MREDRIKLARAIAKRFIQTTDDLLKSPTKDYEIVGSKLSGSVRRASMELTRSLAEMRKA